MVALTINGQAHNIDVDPTTPLLWVIRETSRTHRDKIRLRRRAMRRLHGSYRRTGRALLLDAGRAMRPARRSPPSKDSRRAASYQGAAGLGQPRCTAMRLCQCGMIMAVSALLAEKPKPTDKDIDDAITKSVGAAPSSRSVKRSTSRPTRKGGHHEFYSEDGSPLLPRRHRCRRRRARTSDPVRARRALRTDRSRAPELGVWVVVKPDDTVVVRIVRAEMGQGTITGLAQLVAEELDATGRRSRPNIRHRAKASGASAPGGRTRPAAAAASASRMNTSVRAAPRPA